MVSEQTSLNGQVIIAGRRRVPPRKPTSKDAGCAMRNRPDADAEALARDVAKLLDMQGASELPTRWQRSSSCSARNPEPSDASTGRSDRRAIALASPARAWWTVAVLTFTYIISFVDRTILGLLIEPIKADLSLNDTQIGLVQGMAFGLFYAAMGLPLGWLADRTSRRGLIAVGAALWCAATAACDSPPASFSCFSRVSPLVSARPRSRLPRCRPSAIPSRRNGGLCRSACMRLRQRWVQVWH
jgi:hypothetical protein